MPCYSPLQAVIDTDGVSKPLFPSNREDYVKRGFFPLDLPCRNCVGCRLEHSRQWALRCMHEAQMHSQNCFITLTYDDIYLPSDYSLKKEHFQKFMKRYRKKFGNNIRYYHCGEYGSKYGRPHYHACIFGHDFDDKKLFKKRFGENLYTSADLRKLWPFGYSTVGDLNFKSARYVAGYCMKKQNGYLKKDYYKIKLSDGREFDRTPDYATMSRMPGIGYSWFQKYKTDVYPSDNVIVNGRKCKPPRYYDRLFEKENPDAFQKIKEIRISRMDNHPDSTPDRLEVRRICKEKSLQKLGRDLDDEGVLPLSVAESDPFELFTPAEDILEEDCFFD